jgi:hypothetical protein
MLKSEYLEKKQRWFQKKFDENTWEARWNKWVEDTPMEEVPGRDHPYDVFASQTVNDPEPPYPADELADTASEQKKKVEGEKLVKRKKASKRKT